MAAYSGKSGSVTFGGGAIIKVKSWEIDHKGDVADTTNMASGSTGAKNWTGTLTEWSGTIEGVMDATENKFKGNPPAICALAAGAASFVDGNAKTYSGNIILTSVKITNAVDDVTKFSIDFQGNDALTLPT